MAKGSAGEVDSHLCVALDLGYLDNPRSTGYHQPPLKLPRLFGALMQYLRKSGIKGGKYK